MWIEAGMYSDEDKKKKDKSDKQKKQEEQRILEQEQKKKEAREKNDSDSILSKLEDMLEESFEEWTLSDSDIETIKKIVEKKDIDDNEVEEILQKISEIEETEDVDKYLPKDFRVTAEEYRKSLVDDVARVQTITKLNTALTILANQIVPNTWVGINIFSWYMAILDKKLIKVQENTIDINESLKKVEELKNPKTKENLSLWQRFIRFLKDIFND